jgi:hypothetical protein
MFKIVITYKKYLFKDTIFDILNICIINMIMIIKL